MRVSRSPSGSFIDIVRSSLPARLDQARDQALRAELPQRNARQFVLAIERARPPRYFATIADARSRRIPRQFGELERRGEALFDRQGLVLHDVFQARAPAREFLR